MANKQTKAYRKLGLSTKVVNNPLFPALRSSPTAFSGASRKKQIPSSLRFIAPVTFTVTIGIALSHSSAFAADATWANTSSSAWSTATNWNPAAVPGATSDTTNTDIATFNNIGYQIITLPTAENNGGITFATTGSLANPFFLTGGSYLPSNNAVIQTDSTYLGVADINTGITAQGNLTLTSSGAAGSALFIGSALTTAASLGNVTLTLNGSNSGFNNVFGNIISGVISQNAVGSTLKVSKSGTGTWELNSANTYTGGTDLNGGMLVTNTVTPLGATGTISVLGSTTLRTLTALTDPSARISISDDATLILDTFNANQTWAGVLANSGTSNTAGLTKTGLGALTISPTAGAVQTYKGATTVNMGTLRISGASQTANFTNLIDSSSALILGGGNINFTGKLGLTSSQTFNGTTLNAGISGFIPAASTGTNTFDFGPITRNTGALLDITTAFGYTIKATGTGNDAGGLVRGVLYNGLFATSSSGTLASVTATTENTASNWTTGTANYTTGAAVSGLVGTATINSLTLNNASSQNVATTGALSVNDGILFGSSIGANPSTIGGGILTGPSGGGDLIVVNNNAQNVFGRSTISSVIKNYAASDLGAGADGVTNLILYSRAQNGSLYISGANTYTGNTYIGGGTNALTGSMKTIIGGASGASIGSTSATVFVNGGTGGTTNILQVGNGDATGDVKGTIQLDNGRLSLARTDTFALSAAVSGTGGGGSISQDSTGTASLTLASGTNLFQALGSGAAGTLNLSGTGTYYFNSSATGFNAASTTNFNSGNYYFTPTGNSGNNAIGAWAINGATVTLGGGRYFGSAGGSLTLNSGTFRVQGGAMNQEQQGAASFVYNIAGGNFITTPSSNSGSAASWAPGAGTAVATGNATVNQTAGVATVGSPENTNISNTFNQLQIGPTSASSHISTYNLSGGTLRSYGGIKSGFSTAATGSNNFNWTGGTLTTGSYNANGLTSNNGVSAAATGTLFQAGATSVMAPGETFNGQLFAGKTTITGNYQVDAGTVAIGIGGTTAATVFHNNSTATYDNISVSGATVLGGSVALSFNNGYTPPSNTTQLYNVLVGSVSGVTGTFTNQQVATSGNSRVVLADGLTSMLVATNNTASTATTGGLTSVGARTVALGGYQSGNTYNLATGGTWNAASATSWTNFDPGSSTGASGAIAQFADGASTSPGANTLTLSATRNIQGIQFSSAAGSRAYTITQGSSGAIILDNTANGANATIADTSTSGTANAINVPITLASNLAASVTNAANTLTIGGVISGTGRTLTKTGAGTLTLATANDYTGLTSVTAGTLTLGTSGSLANTAVNVGGNGSSSTPTLAGGGTINGATTIAAAGTGVVGTHSVGVSGVSNGVGTQTFTSTLNYATGSIFEWNLQAASASDPGVVSNAATGTYDQVVASGTAGSVTGSDAVFKIVLGGNAFTNTFWNSNKTWTDIFSGTGAPANLASIFSGGFSGTGVNPDGTVTGNPGNFTFNGSTNTLTWSAVPEPTSALAGLLLGAGLLRRRRSA